MPPTLRDQRTKEVLTIASLFLLISALTPFLVRLLVGAWESRGATYHLVWGVARELGNTDVIFILPTAVYLGLLTLVLLDRMKIVQGLLLAAATLIGSVLLFVEGWLWENVDWIANVHLVLIGYGIGLLMGGGRKLYEEDPPFEFRYAIQWIFLFMTAILGVALLETHVVYENPVTSAGGIGFAGFDPTTLGVEPAGLVTNTALAGAFVVILRLFTNYEYSQSFMVLGPKRGGKTTLMTGVFHTANEVTESTVDANDVLIEHRSKLVQNEPGFGDVDEATQAGEEDLLWFKYDHGQLLRKRVEVEAVDHGGEVLPDLKGEVEKAREQGFPWTFVRNNPALRQLADRMGVSPPGSFRSDAHRRVAESVVDADSLILTVPLDDFVEQEVAPARRPEYYENPRTDPDKAIRPDPADYIAEYQKLLNDFQQAGDDKEVLVVTTMTDLVVDEFKYRHRENDEPLTSEADFLDLERWITNEVINVQADMLLDYSEYDNVLSVYFEMNPNEHAGPPGDPEPNPVLPNGEVTFVGGERFLRELGE